MRPGTTIGVTSMHRFTPYLYLIVALLSLASACQQDAQTSWNGDSAAVTIVTDEQRPSQSSETVPLDTVTAIGTDGDLLLMGTDDGVYRWNGSELVAVDVYAPTVDGPWFTGHVRAIATRAVGTFIATENGIFTTADGVLVPSPLSGEVDGAAITSMAARGEGSEEQLWFVANGVVGVVEGGMHYDIVWPDGVSAPEQVVGCDDLVMVSAGDDVVAIDPAAQTVTHIPGVGRTLDFASTHDQIWTLTERGILAGNAADGWSLFTFTADVTAIGASETVGLYGVSETVGLVAFNGLAGSGAVEVDAVPFETAPGPVSDVVIAGNSSLLALTEQGGVIITVVGTPVSFAADVAPILEATCNSCHATGGAGPLRDFTDYSQVVAIQDAVLERVGTGLMPPASATQLTAAEYETIIHWFATGAQP